MGNNKMLAEEEETFFKNSFTFSSSSSSSYSSSSTTMIINEKDENSNVKKKKAALMALNHVSFVCESLTASVEFYVQVLGFVLIKRPSSFDFQGAWLFNHGIGIHLLEGGDKTKKKTRNIINPKDNHISFQCTNMEVIMEKLEKMNIEYVTAVVKEGGITVDQLFFHDPDGYMIEICNCQNLPLLPLLPDESSLSSGSSSCPLIYQHQKDCDDPSQTPAGKATENIHFCAEDEALMMERLAIEMMIFSF